jgi:hypothetical protein
MSTLRERLRRLRATTQDGERAPTVADGAPSPNVLDMRLSEAVRSAGHLRIRSRLLGEDIVIVPDKAAVDTTDTVTTFSVSEFIELLAVAGSPEMLRTLFRIRKAFGPLDLLDLGLDPRPDLPDHDLWSAALGIVSAEGDRELFGFLHAIRAAGTEVRGKPGSWTLALPSAEWDAAKQRSIRERWVKPLWPRIVGILDRAAGQWGAGPRELDLDERTADGGSEAN